MTELMKLAFKYINLDFVHYPNLLDSSFRKLVLFMLLGEQTRKGTYSIGALAGAIRKTWSMVLINSDFGHKGQNDSLIDVSHHLQNFELS
jgi:hypothetical protein